MFGFLDIFLKKNNKNFIFILTGNVKREVFFRCAKFKRKCNSFILKFLRVIKIYRFNQSNLINFTLFHTWSVCKSSHLYNSSIQITAIIFREFSSWTLFKNSTNFSMNLDRRYKWAVIFNIVWHTHKIIYFTIQVS